MSESDPDRLAEREAEAAAAEAAGIGGRAGDEDLDPAQRPLVEAGEGEAEGFELAEQDLEQHASHGDPAPDPLDLAGRPEPEADEVTAVDGEADEWESAERVDDDR